MVGAAVAHLAANSEPRLKVSLHMAPQHMGHCHPLGFHSVPQTTRPFCFDKTWPPLPRQRNSV